MSKRFQTSAITTLVTALVTASAVADDVVRAETRADLGMQRDGVSGPGVVVPIFDRGIDWRHPDFIKPDGTMRIKFLLDKSRDNYDHCDPGRPPSVEYNEAQFNAALSGGPTINSRDANGDGTDSPGIAAGSGRAFGTGRYIVMCLTRFSFRRTRLRHDYPQDFEFDCDTAILHHHFWAEIKQIRITNAPCAA